MGKLASIDIGTHSTRLLVGIVRNGVVEEIERQTIITKLGEGIKDKYIKPEALSRTTEVLTSFMDIINSHGAGRIAVFATSAVRDAKNKDDFIGVLKKIIGVEPQILDGGKEAALSFNGVCAALKKNNGLKEKIIVIDIGGGSTELAYGICGSDKISATSLNIGCLRMKEQFIHSDPPESSEIALLENHIKSTIKKTDIKPPGDIRAYAVAGTATSVIAMKLQLEKYDRSKVHMQKIGLPELRKMTEKLSLLSLKDLMLTKGLEPQRAPVIVPGMIILKSIMEIFRFGVITVSESDILDGALLSIT